MATKSANLYARIEPDVKEKAESILSTLGIPASSAINMFYKQIILQRGLPFEVKIPSAKPVDISTLSEAELNEELEKGYDIVYGYYPEKKHSAFRNFGSWVNYISVRILIGKPKELKTSSYWVARKFVRDSVIEYQAPYAYIQGLFLRTTRNISCIPIQHFQREEGESNYTFKRLLKLWSNIIGFSITPLRLTEYCGFGLSLLSIIAAVVVLIRKILNPAMALGWPSLMIVICFFSGIQLMFLGLIGEYIGRMFLGLNRQPQYVIREVIRQESEEQE